MQANALGDWVYNMKVQTRTASDEAALAGSTANESSLFLTYRDD